jgi:hypothetical protein
LFTLNVPRLEIPFSPGPIFFASLSAKWQMPHFWSNTSFPLVADPDDFPAAFFEVVFAGGSCAKTAAAIPNNAIPRTKQFRFTSPPSSLTAENHFAQRLRVRLTVQRALQSAYPSSLFIAVISTQGTRHKVQVHSVHRWNSRTFDALKTVC